MESHELVKPSKGKHHVYYNANPAHKETTDCIIRALAVAFDKKWIEVFDELSTIARENFESLGSKEVYSKYLERQGAEYIKTMEKGKKRLSGEDFARQYKSGIYILRMANHLTVCVGGVIYDTWDCSGEIVYNAWLVR